jgi:hypothetical protein
VVVVVVVKVAHGLTNTTRDRITLVHWSAAMVVATLMPMSAPSKEQCWSARSTSFATASMAAFARRLQCMSVKEIASGSS